MYRWQIRWRMFIFLINSVLYSVLKAYKSKIKTISVFENFKTWLAVDHLSILTGVVGGKVSAPWNHPFPLALIAGPNHDALHTICSLERFVLSK